MVTMERNGILSFFCFVCFFKSSNTFTKRCPELAELEIYAKRKCSNRKEYHCLAEDSIEFHKIREECRTPELVSHGNYPVFRGRYIDYETCPADSYQPILFRSNERAKCTFRKSECSSHGQVEVNAGTPISDKACRCNYNKGFAFTIRPKKQCTCNPLEEDCSCFIKRCAEGQTLNSDYQCSPTTDISGSTTCNVITLTDTADANPNNSSIFKTILITVVTPNNILERGLIYLMLLLAIFVTVVFSIIIMCVSSCQCGLCFRKETEKSDPVPTVKSKTTLSLSDSNYLTTGEKSGVNSHWKRINNDTKDNWKGEEQRECTQKSDIFILHDVTDLSIVNIFKGRLTSPALEESYNDIKLFENVISSSGTILLHDVIKHCKLFIFFMSKRSFVTDVKQHGLTDTDINSVLNMRHEYPMIRIVGANKHLNFKTDFKTEIKLDMDYSKYIESTIDIASCKSELKSMLKGREGAEIVIK